MIPSSPLGLKVENYDAPEWSKQLKLVPTHRIPIGRLPTPIFPWKLSGLDGYNLYIKRDDLSGLELSGNKVRKSEFLLAEAIAQNCDCTVTVGGIQSNHSRATAAASRLVGLDPHSILRTDKIDDDPGLSGNLMLMRMIDTQLHLVTVEDYRRVGPDALVAQLCDQLRNAGKKPYAIPLGGSNSLGTWGYIEAFRETFSQLAASGIAISDVVFSCGSGGTAAGLALGAHLSKSRIKIHGFIASDSNEYFHHHVNEIFKKLGVGVKSEEILNLVDTYKGIGYAQNTQEEMDFFHQIAATTGIILDPVYTGKAAYGMVQSIKEKSPIFQGRDILFIHTGGLFGLFPKEQELLNVMKGVNIHPFKVPQ